MPTSAYRCKTRDGLYGWFAERYGPLTAFANRHEIGGANFEGAESWDFGYGRRAVAALWRARAAFLERAETAAWKRSLAAARARLDDLQERICLHECGRGDGAPDALSLNLADACADVLNEIGDSCQQTNRENRAPERATPGTTIDETATRPAPLVRRDDEYAATTRPASARPNEIEAMTNLERSIERIVVDRATLRGRLGSTKGVLFHVGGILTTVPPVMWLVAHIVPDYWILATTVHIAMPFGVGTAVSLGARQLMRIDKRNDERQLASDELAGRIIAGGFEGQTSVTRREAAIIKEDGFLSRMATIRTASERALDKHRQSLQRAELEKRSNEERIDIAELFATRPEITAHADRTKALPERIPTEAPCEVPEAEARRMKSISDAIAATKDHDESTRYTLERTKQRYLPDTMKAYAAAAAENADEAATRFAEQLTTIETGVRRTIARGQNARLRDQRANGEFLRRRFEHESADTEHQPPIPS